MIPQTQWWSYLCTNCAYVHSRPPTAHSDPGKTCTWHTVRTAGAPFIIVTQVWMKLWNINVTSAWQSAFTLALMKLYPVNKEKSPRGSIVSVSHYTLKSTLLAQGDHQLQLMWITGSSTHHITPSAMSLPQETAITSLSSKKEPCEHSRLNKGLRSIFFSCDNEFHISKGNLSRPHPALEYISIRHLSLKNQLQSAAKGQGCPRARARLSRCGYMWAVSGALTDCKLAWASSEGLGAIMT